jgi:hypothetical protein
MAVHGRDRYYVGEVCELDLGYDTVALLVPLMPRTFPPPRHHSNHRHRFHHC